jgi:hypothetical protein
MAGEWSLPGYATRSRMLSGRGSLGRSVARCLSPGFERPEVALVDHPWIVCIWSIARFLSSPRPAPSAGDPAAATDRGGNRWRRPRRHGSFR